MSIENNENNDMSGLVFKKEYTALYEAFTHIGIHKIVENKFHELMENVVCSSIESHFNEKDLESWVQSYVDLRIEEALKRVDEYLNGRVKAHLDKITEDNKRHFEFNKRHHATLEKYAKSISEKLSEG